MRAVDLDILRLQAMAASCAQDLHKFTREFVWPIVEPKRPFSDNWTQHAIAEHLQAVVKGDIQDLVVTIPPRFMKSISIGIAFPTWIWTFAPETRFIYSSYSGPLATRDAVKSRRVIESGKYQMAYGDMFRMTSDQNVKTNYQNDKTGQRFSTSVNGVATGEGGDYLVCDDPHNVKEAESDAQRESVLQWWDESMSSRLNDQSTGHKIVIQQRVHNNDLADHCISKGYEHLNIPMEWEERDRKITSLGWTDPRTEEGQLAWPERFPAKAVKRLRDGMTDYAYEAQYQQRPTPRAGVIFKRECWRYYNMPVEQLAASMDEIILSCDAAFKGKDTSDFVAIHVWGRKGANKFLLDRQTERMSFSQTISALKVMYAKWRKYLVAVLIEDKANGPAIMDTLADEIPGLLAVDPLGGKVPRAHAMSHEQQAGNVYLPSPLMDGYGWIINNGGYVDTAAKFPLVKHDDDIDAMTQAINWFRTRAGLPPPRRAPAIAGKRTF